MQQTLIAEIEQLKIDLFQLREEINELKTTFNFKYKAGEIQDRFTPNYGRNLGNLFANAMVNKSMNQKNIMLKMIRSMVHFGNNQNSFE